MLEGAAVAAEDAEDGAVVAGAVVETGAVVAATPFHWYMFSLLGPPHISLEFPLQGMLHSAFPSGAGPPPLRSWLSQ
jgi:hypothetical protein